MTLYDIDSRITGLVDAETGEIKDYDEFLALSMQREEKIDNTGAYIKNLRAEAAAIKEEIAALKARKLAAENRAERLARYLADYLGGEPFRSGKLAISYRRSTALKVEDEDAFILRAYREGWDWALTEKPPEINRAAVTKAVKSGWDFGDGVQLVERQNIQIK